MDSENIKSNVNFWTFLSILGIIGSILIFVATSNYGVGVSADSYNYLHMAAEIAEGKKISTATWPPLYPVVLTLFSYISNADLIKSARILNSLLFGFIIFTSGILSRKEMHLATFFDYLILVVFIIMKPLMTIHLMAWSEPLFVSLIILYLIFLRSYLIKRQIILLLISSFIIALACLARYVGFVFIFSGTLCIFLNRKSFRGALSEMTLFGVTSFTPIFLWVLRNYFVVGSFTGERSTSNNSLFENVRALFETMFNWIFYGSLESPILRAILFLGIILVSGHLIIRGCLKRVSPHNKFYLLEITVICYAIAIIILSTLSRMDKLTDRLMSPLAIPFFILLLSITRKIGRVLGQSLIHRWPNLLSNVFIYLFIILSLPNTVSMVSEHLSNGAGYTSRYWKENHTLAYVQNSTSDCHIFSNGPDIIRFSSDKYAQFFPWKKRVENETIALNKMKYEWSKEDSICMVWFDFFAYREYLFSLDELLSVEENEDCVFFDDGTICIISSNE